MLAQRRRNIPDVSLLTQRSYCYRMLLSIVPAAGDIALTGMRLLRILVRMHVVGLRERGRSVGDCSRDDNI